MRLISEEDVLALQQKYEGYLPRDIAHQLWKDIKNLPTAYDIENVKTEIQDAGCKMSEAKIGHTYYKAISVKKAMKIIDNCGLEPEYDHLTKSEMVDAVVKGLEKTNHEIGIAMLDSLDDMMGRDFER